MVIEHINFTPTMNCNLKCESCGVLVPHYSYRPQMDVDECDRTLKVLFEILDRVERFQITGGEPLVHPQIDQIIQSCVRYINYIDELWLFSNCTIPLKESVLETLKGISDKVLVHLSDYGVRKDVAEDNIKKLEAYAIPYRYLKYYGEQESQYYNGWVDQGDFVPHGRSLEENKRVFASCTHVMRGGSWYVRQGKIHWCGRSIRGMEVGKIPDASDDYLDLFENVPIEEKRAKLKKLMEADVITACEYCNGLYGTTDDGQRIPAGRQIT